MKSIKTKLIIIMLSLSLSLLFIMQAFMIYSEYSQSQKSIAYTEKKFLEQYDSMIKGQVKSVLSLIGRVDRYQAARGVDLASRKILAKEIVREVKYSKSSYFWIDTYDGINVLQPPTPEIEGKSRIALKDVKGKEIVREIIEKARTSDGGFTDYWYPKPGEQEASRKRAYSGEYKPFGWVVASGNYIDDIDREISQLRAESDAILMKSIFVSVIVFAVAVIVAFVVALIMGKSISNPIVEISSFIKRVADGDLTVRINREHVKKKDEIGRMVGDMRNLRNALIGIISNIRGMSDELSASSEETATAADTFSSSSQKQAAAIEEINATIEEVTAGVNTVNSNAKEQLGSVELLADSVKTLKAIEKNIDETVQSISDLSSDVSGRADEGNNSLLTMQKRFGEISQSSGNMLDVVNVITDIADQINLLSLNAAIESARAGEAGRGFAVVADEISKLAEETSINVKTIQQNIVLNDEKIKQGEVIVNDSLDKLKIVIEGVRTIAESIKSVENEINTQAETSNVVNAESGQVKRKSEEIQAAINEQNIAMEEITSSIGNINQTVQATAAGSEEIAGSSAEVSRLSQNLQSQISVFRLPGKEELEEMEKPL